VNEKGLVAFRAHTMKMALLKYLSEREEGKHSLIDLKLKGKIIEK
jgi:hypothetical protein